VFQGHASALGSAALRLAPTRSVSPFQHSSFSFPNFQLLLPLVIKRIHFLFIEDFFVFAKDVLAVDKLVFIIESFFLVDFDYFFCNSRLFFRCLFYLLFFFV
jgi:hypothetical protein